MLLYVRFTKNMNHMQILTKNAKILWNGLSLEKTSKSDKPGYAEEGIFSKKSPVKSQPTVGFKRKLGSLFRIRDKIFGKNLRKSSKNDNTRKLWYLFFVAALTSIDRYYFWRRDWTLACVSTQIWDFIVIS